MYNTRTFEVVQKRTRTFEVVQKRTGEFTIDKYSYLELQVQRHDVVAMSGDRTTSSRQRTSQYKRSQYLVQVQATSLW